MEEFKRVCSNPWCKAQFSYNESQFVNVNKTDPKTGKVEEVQKEHPKVCPKCQSFDRDLSGGVEWKNKTYDGDRFDGMPHQIKYKVTNYK